MSEDANKLTAEQLDNWTFSDEPIAAPEAYDPNAEGFESPPPGWHTMELYDFVVVPDTLFKYKGNECVLDQLRPKFRVAKGKPFAGATTMDFLPMPTRGVQMLPELANRWVHFFKRLMGESFTLPDGVLVPAGFKIKELKGKLIDVHCVIDMDQNGEPKLNKNSEQQISPKFFGYAYAGSNSGAGGASQSDSSSSSSRFPSKGPSSKPQPVGAGAASGPSRFDL